MFDFWREATAASVPGFLWQSGRRRPENVRKFPCNVGFARRTKNKESLLEIYRGYIPELAIIELFIVNVSGFVCG